MLEDEWIRWEEKIERKLQRQESIKKRKEEDAKRKKDDVPHSAGVKMSDWQKKKKRKF